MKKTLLKILGSPSITIILGKRGGGKTATGMKFLEEAHEAGMKCYAVGIPKKKWHLLPDYIITVKNLNDVEDQAAVFSDEIYLTAHARESMKISNKAIAKILGVARQKDWTLLFAAHSSRKMDMSIISGCDNILFKRQSIMHVKFERKELKRMVTQAYKFFLKKKRQGQDTRAWCIIFSEDNLPDGPLAVKYNLPKFWTLEISKAFSGLKITEI